MNNEEMRGVILQMIDRFPAIRTVDLALHVMERVNPTRFEFSMFQDELDRLKSDKQVIELKYKLRKDNEFVIKSIYFPKGTVTNI